MNTFACLTDTGHIITQFLSNSCLFINSNRSRNANILISENFNAEYCFDVVFL